MSPFPHLVMENELDPGVFAEWEHGYPSDEIVVDGKPSKDAWYDFAACRVAKSNELSPVWREFFRYHTSAEFYLQLVSLCGDAIRQLHPDIEANAGRALEEFRVGMRPGGRGDPLASGADISMECQFYLNYTRQLRVVRGPHIDRPSELFAALLYFRQPSDDSTGGNLEICEATEDIYPTPQSVKVDSLPMEVSANRVKTVGAAPYKPNTLVLFLNSPKSLHAVVRRSPTPISRRHINFCGDLNFDLFGIKLPARLKLKQSLQSMPLGWRIAKHL